MKKTRWLLASLIVAALAGPALARSEKTLAYQREQCWPTAVRFLRVDEGLKLIEKDADAGYVLFELKEDGKTFRGSLEVMTVSVDGRTVVRFVIQIEDRPSWLEIAMLTRLERKLRSELGAPSPPPSKAKDRDKDRDKEKADKDRPKDEPPKSSDPPRPDEGGPPVSPTP
ncbi:MAG: hypothetical protein H0T89_05615 [Deltaproteobacteria bacterium]|nr:hypothetical protein [Deltaproteobacteria bacterium]MDQ3295281.1 hypothetical protein [Myxococcota bacterium]